MYGSALTQCFASIDRGINSVSAEKGSFTNADNSHTVRAENTAVGPAVFGQSPPLVVTSAAARHGVLNAYAQVTVSRSLAAAPS